MNNSTPALPSSLPDHQNHKQLFTRLRICIHHKLGYPEDIGWMHTELDLIQLLEDVEWDTQRLENLVKKLESEIAQP